METRAPVTRWGESPGSAAFWAVLQRVGFRRAYLNGSSIAPPHSFLDCLAHREKPAMSVVALNLSSSKTMTRMR